MIRVESKRVLQHADDKNFLSWMESWYTDWETTLADKLEEIGLDRDLSTRHCAESKKQLLEATNSKPESFKNALENCVKTWENRVFLITNGNKPSQNQEKLEDNDISTKDVLLSIVEMVKNQKQGDINVTVSPPPPQELTIQNDIHVPPQVAPEINVTNDVKTPSVYVTNEVPKQDSPIVNVTNEVKPAAVDVNVSLPTRKTITRVTRDRNGAITGSEQTEEDA
jgi:hypothetical protein